MSQAPVLHCDCCGLPIAPEAGEDCPRCHYPINIQKEERFLEASICDLQRVAEHGGAKLSVVDLIRRYQDRLNYLHKFQAQTDTTPGIQTPFPEPQAASQIAESQASVPLVALPVMPVEQQPVSLVQRPGQVFSFRTFLADQTINIIASLGAFIGLVGALSFVATTTSLWLSFLVLFIVQAVFGGVGISTYRFASFRVVAIIYTVIFALLVPLVGFSGYRLVLGHLVPLSVPTLIALAAGYAAIVYGTLAVYQHFKPFGYLGVLALAVTDMAVAHGLNLATWWWPALLMLLAFLALLALPRPGGSEHPFIGVWAILREPVRVLTFVIAGVCALSIVLTGIYSFALDSSNAPFKEVRLAILCMTALLLLWTCLALWLSKRTRWLLSIAYLFLACVLAFCYAFNFQLIWYVLVLTGVALLYHGLTRFAARLLAHFAYLSLGLDQLALVLVGIVPLVSWPSLPLELLMRAYQNPADVTSPLLFQFQADTVVELLAVALGLAVSISVALHRAGLSHMPDKTRAGWCWLLLLSGVLLNWIYTVIILASGAVPVWSFLGLSLLLVAAAVMVRQQIGAAWANPFDVLALSEIMLTLLLSFNQSTDIIIGLMLFFAALLYGVLLYQRRRAWLALPFVLALLALPLLSSRPRILLVAALLLPFAAVVIYRFVTKQRNASVSGTSTIPNIITGWEWPLVTLGLLYGIVISLLDTVSPHSAVQNWTGLAFPVALEVAMLALVWYAAAALSRLKFWLLPAIGFAIAAFLFPNNSFWALLVVTPLATVLAVGVSRSADRGWALPLYIVALLGAVMAGYTGAAQHQGIAVTWAMLTFAFLAFIVMLVERTPEWLVFPALLAAWAIWQWYPPLTLVPLMVAYSLLCVLIFVSQFAWKLVSPAPLWLPAPRMARILSLSGQVLVVLAIIQQGGLSADAGLLAHVGAGALLVLALLLFWYGRLQSLPVMWHWCDYGSGLLASLVISWELLAFRQANLDLLTLAPATYLIVIAPLLSRDETLPLSMRHRAGQLASLLGSFLLLLPTLWLSFGSENNNLLYTLVLIGEALALLLLGIGTRVRIFVLSGAGLVIIGALHALFLPALSIPPSLALTVLGAMLLTIATGLSLARHRIQVAWSHWE